MAEAQQQQNINIKIPDDVLKGSYVNNMFVSHTKDEFILDFINIAFFPPPGQGVVVSKIITNPAHFKKMVAALNDNLKKFEAQFGKIEEGKGQTPAQPTSTSDRPFGFSK